MAIAPATVTTGSLASSRPVIFAGHQTFALRSGWLKKGLDALQDPHIGGAGFFTRPDALVHLGVGKNMVQSIRYWLAATGVATESSGTRSRDLEPSSLGKTLLGDPENEGWDPYLEDPASRWILHWEMATPGGPAYSWCWVFNVLREYEFSKESLVEGIAKACASKAAKAPSSETLARDVECLLHCYVEPANSKAAEDDLDCPFRSLGLIQPCFGRHYRFVVGAKPSLPLEVFVYALTTYWIRRFPQSPTLSVQDLTYGEGSPGLVFKLDEDSVLAYLDHIAQATADRYRFEDTPLVRQVVRADLAVMTPLDLLRGYYEVNPGADHVH